MGIVCDDFGKKGRRVKRAMNPPSSPPAPLLLKSLSLQVFFFFSSLLSSLSSLIFYGFFFFSLFFSFAVSNLVYVRRSTTVVARLSPATAVACSAATVTHGPYRSLATTNAVAARMPTRVTVCLSSLRPPDE